MYDEGRLPTSPSKFAEEKESVRTSKSTDTSTGSRESKARQQQQHYENFNANNFDESARSKGPHTGRTEQYDFDAWLVIYDTRTKSVLKYRKFLNPSVYHFSGLKLIIQKHLLGRRTGRLPDARKKSMT